MKINSKGPNASMVSLGELRSLQSLDIYGCRRITYRGVELLKARLPNIKVVFF